MVPIFSSYKINDKHRAFKPSPKASIWKISEWEEVRLFATASDKNWYKNGIFWAIIKTGSKKLKLGEDLDNDLCIAKYLCGSNSDWHGYPVHPKDKDIPPNEVLDLWLEEGLIDKADKRKIQRGQFFYEA
jgi:hypothetical protein